MFAKQQIFSQETEIQHVIALLQSFNVLQEPFRMLFSFEGIS